MPNGRYAFLAFHETITGRKKRQRRRQPVYEVLVRLRLRVYMAAQQEKDSVAMGRDDRQGLSLVWASVKEPIIAIRILPVSGRATHPIIVEEGARRRLLEPERDAQVPSLGGGNVPIGHGLGIGRRAPGFGGVVQHHPPRKWCRRRTRRITSVNRVFHLAVT